MLYSNLQLAGVLDWGGAVCVSRCDVDVTSEVAGSHVGLSTGVCLFYVYQMEYIHRGIGPPT